MSAAYRGRVTPTTTYRARGGRSVREWFGFTVAALALALTSTHVAFGADGSDVAAKLGDSADLVAHLTDSISTDGAYGDQENASSVPFLGGAPGSLISGLFSKLSGLGGFDNFAPADTDKVQVVVDKVSQVAGGLGGTLTATYQCGSGACDPGTNTVDQLTSVDLSLGIGASDSRKIPFSSLNLPSVGFGPVGQELDVQLSWSVSINLTADANGLRMTPTPNTHMLDLGVTITAPTAPFKVDLGALEVMATTLVAPSLHGHLYVDIDSGGNPEFGFSPNTGFEAKWGLAATTSSPLPGVTGNLSVNWNLGTSGLDAKGLEISVDDVKIKTSEFVGQGIQDAAAGIRDVVHPIRKATSPMLEPIPGLSDLSSLVGGGDVTMLRLMNLAKSVDPGSPTSFPYGDLETAIKRIQMLDDVVADLAGGNDVDLGSFKLTGDDALTPNGQALAKDAVDELENIVDDCSVCKEQLGNLLKAVNGSETPGEGGFRFDIPVMNNPASLAGMLLGRNVDLITFDSGFLGYKGDLDTTVARFLIFAVKVQGPIEAGIHLRGGVDTAGISDALRSGKADQLLHGVFLQDPGTDPVVRLSSKVHLALSTDVELVGVSLTGGPDADINLRVPAATPEGKLRPAALQDNLTTVGCELLKAGHASFAVSVTAKFDYFLGSHDETLADHTFLTDKDICDTDADATPIAEPDGRNVFINPAAIRNLPAGEPDLIQVYMVHDASGSPTAIVVTGNNGVHREFAAADFDSVSYDSSDDARPVIFRAVKNGGKPFEKRVSVTTGDGADDVVVDSSAFGTVTVNDGADKVVVTAGDDPSDPGKAVSGGKGDDLIIGGDSGDILQGDEGDDRIEGGGGKDRLGGGPGNDVLEDNSLDGNCLVGGADTDLLISGFGADTLFGDETFFCAGGGVDPEATGDAGDGGDTIITGGGSDVVFGGGGNDTIRLHGSGVFDGTNAAWLAGVTVQGNDGNDTITTGNGQDWIHGGRGDDTIVADSAPREATVHFGDADTIYGGTGGDTITAGGGGDIVYGDTGRDSCSTSIVGQPGETDTTGGDDTVYGGPGDDVIALEAGDDHAYGEDSDDVICGHAGTDTIYGDDKPTDNEIFQPGAGSGDDTIFGGTGADELHGGFEDDLLYGNAGGDTLSGDEGNDRLVGGSSAPGVPDDGDTINGGDGADVIVGDNGTISSASPRVVHVFDLFASDATRGGGDTIYGDADDDRAFGGIGNDTIHGVGGDDMLQGNSGDDAIYGDANDDDIIGGTSDEALPGATAGQAAADAPDGAETILSGGSGRDVVIGDNGNITRPGGTDPILGGPARSVTLFDRDRTGAALAAVSGGDYIEGNADSDRLYGEGGDDYVKGNGADDYAEGNQGGDRLEGNAGDDDLIGGSSFTVTAGVGDPDGADQIAGGAGADAILGDNAMITRGTTGSGSGFDWDSVANNWLGQDERRSITLLDKATLTAGKYGDDTLSGGAGPDVLFGQDGADPVYGGAHDDYMEGNGGADVLYGDQDAPATGDAHESGQPELDGAPGPDGQDDQVGGSSWIRSTARGAVTGQRDGDDEIHGNGEADVQLGDNGRILRVIVGGQYKTYQAETGKATIVRQASPTGTTVTALPARYDVGAAASAGVWGNDTLYGGAGDDLQLAGDGNDTLYGGAGDDDMYGELGDDRMFGETGEDAMVGDRGVITDRLVATPGATISVTSPPNTSFTPFAAHPLDRRVDLNDDGDGAPLQSPGMTTGGNDFMRGGADHDAMHGAFGDDLMNGDSGGDYLFGDDGADVMWGGKGKECADPADDACNSDRGENDTYVDYLFGGNGLKSDPVTGGADILDFRPRPGTDPAAWFEATSTRATDPVADHQHHQGVDWIYGGWDRDVMQADIADNGPNPGDRLMDWVGAYNLYDHCPAAYGGYNDVRLFSPSLQTFLQQLAYSLGAGKSLADVQAKGTSGYNELALVFNGDVKANSGSAYPGTPGHFDTFSCAP